MGSEKAYLTLEEVQQEELAILTAFAQFCESHGLYYSLAGGTLLGAIRHKGFIPWDDDIDVNMPRADYERLIALGKEFESETGFELRPFGRSKAAAPLLKIVNPHIQLEYPEGKKSRRYFLWIDVIPIDGITQNEAQAKQVYSRIYSLRNIFTISEYRWALGLTPFRAFVRAAIAPFVMLFGLDKFCAHQMKNIALATPYDSAEKVAAITWGLYGPGEAMEKAAYLTADKVEFCGKTFNGLSCWDEYLSNLYGNYMQLPPEDKRICHDVKVWRIEPEQV